MERSPAPSFYRVLDLPPLLSASDVGLIDSNRERANLWLLQSCASSPFGSKRPSNKMAAWTDQ